MKKLKFKVWDKIGERWLNVLYLMLAPDGSIMAAQDIHNEIYGMHQVELKVEKR